MAQQRKNERQTRTRLCQTINTPLQSQGKQSVQTLGTRRKLCCTAMMLATSLMNQY